MASSKLATLHARASNILCRRNRLNFPAMRALNICIDPMEAALDFVSSESFGRRIRFVAHFPSPPARAEHFILKSPFVHLVIFLSSRLTEHSGSMLQVLATALPHASIQSAGLGSHQRQA